MKQVWIFNHYAHLPTDVNGLTRHYSLARHLRQFGWQASIVAATTLHPSGVQRADQGSASRLEFFDDVPFLWLKSPGYSGNGRDRLANMLAYAYRATSLRALRALEAPDVIIGSTLHPAGAVAAAIVAKRLEVPFLFEVRDLWPLALVEMGRLREGSVPARILAMIEAWLHRRSAITISVWPRMSEYFHAIAKDKPVVHIPNGIDLDSVAPPQPLPRHDGFDLMYLGAHGGANGLDNALKAMREVQSDPRGASIRLRLVGDGPLKPMLRELASRLELRNVTFEAPVPKHEVPQVAAQADAFLLSLIDAPLFKYGISPNKLFDYMAAQRPVIATVKAGDNPISASAGGLTVPPGRPGALAEAILTIAHKTEAERLAMAEKARAYVVEHHSFEHLAKVLATTMDDCFDQDRRYTTKFDRRQSSVEVIDSD